MNEIEIKAKLRDREKVVVCLEKIGAELLGTKFQKDIAYWPNHIKEIGNGKKLLGVNYLRIREQKSRENKRIIFTIKQPQKNQADCKEFEIDVKEEEIENLKSIISLLGFYEFCTIEKERTIYRIGNIEVCLDEITDLGSYIELEKFGDDNEVEKIQSELVKMLESWGVKKEDITTNGYDILMQEKQLGLS
jgi:adenylate cyclase class 2